MLKMSFIFIYITAPNKREARKIAEAVITNKLAGCANFFPMTSIYRWKGKLHHGSEVILILKTIAGKAPLVKKVIEKMHPFETPCITLIPVKPNQKYARWLQEQVK